MNEQPVQTAPPETQSQSAWLPETPRTVTAGLLNLAFAYVFLAIAVLGFVFFVLNAEVFSRLVTQTSGWSMVVQLFSPIPNIIGFVALFVSGYLLLKHRPAALPWLRYGGLAVIAAGIYQIIATAVQPSFMFSFISVSTFYLLLFILYPILINLLVYPPAFFAFFDPVAPENPRVVVVAVLNLTLALNGLVSLLGRIDPPSVGVSFELFPAQPTFSLIVAIVSFLLYAASGYLLLRSKALGKTLNLAVVLFTILTTLLNFILMESADNLLFSMLPWQFWAAIGVVLLASLAYPVVSVLLLNRPNATLGLSRWTPVPPAPLTADLPLPTEVQPEAAPESSRRVLIGATNIQAASLFLAVAIAMLLYSTIRFVPAFDWQTWGILLAFLATGILLLWGGIRLLQGDPAAARHGRLGTIWSTFTATVGVFFIMYSIAPQLDTLWRSPAKEIISVILVLLLIPFALLAYPITAWWVVKQAQD